MRRSVGVLLFGLLGAVLSTSLLWAQATAQISGTVKDQSGAVLPGVEVTVTQIETGIARSAVTNENGSYVLSNLAIGPYRLEAGLPGFRTFAQTGIVLQVNSSAVINPVLEVGQVTEQVEVKANTALVETRSLSVGQVMETARIVELPLNGRNAQELVLLQGGATLLTSGGKAFPGRLVISSAGSLGISTDYTLDGIRHVDAWDGYPMPLPFPDALAEFKTEIGGLAASQGKGTQVSAVTKSGTNDFHGDLFEFVRNDLFNARNYFATAGSTLKRNQFGGTAGGPVIKNKLFFFGGYQGTTLRQDPNDTRSFVPTAAMLAGDFTTFTSPACNAGRQITLRAPFVNNRIDPALFSPAALKIAARLPKTDNACGELTYGQRTIEDQKQVVTKIDYQVSPKHSLFGRYLYATSDSPSSYKFTPDNVLNANSGKKARAHAFAAGSTYLISPTTVNAFRLSYTMERTWTSTSEFFGPEEVGIKVYGAYVPKAVGIRVTSGFTLSAGPTIYGGELYQIADDVSMTRGRHQFGFGGRVAQARANPRNDNRSVPTFTLSGTVTGAGLADFLTGKVDNFTQGIPGQSFSRTNYLSLYGQDTWQLKPRLTVSFGLRFSPVLPIVEYRRPIPIVMNFDMDRYRQGLRSTVFVNAPPGMLYPGDPGFAQNNNGASAAKPKADLWKPYWNQFAPRLGFAWDVEGNGRTSVRASYGLSYEEYPAGTYRLGTQLAQPPWGSFTRMLQPEGGLDDPWRGVPGGNPFPLQLTTDMPFVRGGEYLPSNPYLTPSYMQSWNLSLQRELVPGTLVSLSYMGTAIVHLQAASSLNMSVFVPGVGDASGSCFLNGKITHFKVTPGSPCSTVNNTDDRRQLAFVNPAFVGEIGRLADIVNGGTQGYNGMLVSVQHRSASGISLNGNYTWSHCVGDFGGRANVGNGNECGSHVSGSH